MMQNFPQILLENNIYDLVAGFCGIDTFHTHVQ